MRDFKVNPRGSFIHRQSFHSSRTRKRENGSDVSHLPRTLAGMPPPESIQFESKEVPVWTYVQLEKLSKMNLKQRAH